MPKKKELPEVQVHGSTLRIRPNGSVERNGYFMATTAQLDAICERAVWLSRAPRKLVASLRNGDYTLSYDSNGTVRSGCTHVTLKQLMQLQKLSLKARDKRK